MRRIVIWLASTVTVAVLLFGYHTSTDSAATETGSSSTSTPAAPSTTTTPKASDPPKPSASSSSSSSPSSSSSAGTKSYTGDVAQTRWGPVEVEITVTAGKITKVTVVQSPSGNGRDTEINSRALPVLQQETISAQSAKIDMVSGATVTSDGYLTSLQSAIDRAGI
ncbi:MAG TPA: FMN-binding protein [Friedmanniella sp.]